MEQILSNSSDRSRMKNDEHFQFYTEIIELIERHEYVKLKIDAPYAAMRQARKMQDAACDIIIRTVNSRAVVEGQEDYIEFIRAMNRLITDFKNILKQREGRNKANRNKNQKNDNN